jgi:uncharacterized membrane protein YsdA (DUF1294 family)
LKRDDREMMVLMYVMTIAGMAVGFFMGIIYSEHKAKKEAVRR